MAKKKDEIGVAEKGEETPPEGKPETTPAPEQETGLKPQPKPEEETFTWTKKERDDFVTAEKATIGRELKTALDVNTTLKRTIDGQGTRITTLESNIESVRKASRDRELSDAAGNTEVVDAIKLKHKNEDEATRLSKDRSDFNQERTQHQADIDEVAKTKATKLAEDLAKESGLTADLLLQIGSDQDKDNRTVYNLERMKSIASKSPKGKDEEDEEVEEKADTAVKGQRAKAASTGRAATGLRTWNDFEKAYVAGEISREEYGKAAKRFNVQL